MRKTITQAHIDGFDIATGERPARPEPSLAYVVAIRFFRYAVGFGLLVGAGACAVKFLTSFTR